MVGGFWGFIIVFGVVLFGWMILNFEVLGNFGKVFDLYFYIFFNLLLFMLVVI